MMRRNIKKSLRKEKSKLSNKRNSLKKVKSRLSNKKNSKSKKKGGAWLQRRLNLMDSTNFFDSTKRLKMRILGINLLKQMGINPQSQVDCGCLENDDCEVENVCDLYRNKCVIDGESDEAKTERRIKEINQLDDFYFGKKTALDFINYIQEKIEDKFPSTSIDLPIPDKHLWLDIWSKEEREEWINDWIKLDALGKLKYSLKTFIISQRKENKMMGYDQGALGGVEVEDLWSKLDKFLDIFYPTKTQEIKEVLNKEDLNKYSVFQILNSYPKTRENLNQAIKIPDGISKEDWVGLSDLSKKDKSRNLTRKCLAESRNLISRKCLAESFIVHFTSGEKYPLGILLPCILLTTKWSSILDLRIIKHLNIIKKDNQNLLLQLEEGNLEQTIQKLKTFLEEPSIEKEQNGGAYDEGSSRTWRGLIMLVILVIFFCLI